MTLVGTTVWGRRAAAVIALAAATAAAPSAAQPAWFSPEVLADHFAAGVADPAAIRAELEAVYGPVADPIWAVMERHMVGIQRNPGYADYVYANGAPFVSMDMTIADLTLVTMQVDLRATMNGILRLPQKRQEALLRVSGDVMRWLGENRPDACVEAVLGTDMSAAARDEFAFAAAQSPAYVDAYYTVVYSALAAEIAGVPEMQRIDTNLEDLDPFRVYQSNVIDLVQASPDAQDIMMAIAAGTTTNPKLLCDFGVMTIEAIFMLSPADRATVVPGILGEAAGLAPMPG